MFVCSVKLLHRDYGSDSVFVATVLFSGELMIAM